MSLVLNMVGGGGSGGGSKPSPTDAVLSVTAPSGSTVTITKSGVTRIPNFYLVGTDTDTFFYYIKANDFGTYTVTATLGDKSKTETITINFPQEYSVVVIYQLYLYDSGNEYSSITGGWMTGDASPRWESGWAGSALTMVRDEAYLKGSANGNGVNGTFRPTNAIDLTSYSTLIVDAYASTGNSKAQFILIYSPSNIPTLYTSAPIHHSLTLGSRKTASIDVSSLSGEYYIACGVVGFGALGQITLYSMHLE